MLNIKPIGEIVRVKGDPGGFTDGNYGMLRVPHPSNKPNRRAYAANWRDRAGNLYLFGGFGAVARTQPNYTGLLNDMWKIGSAVGDYAVRSAPVYVSNIKIKQNPATSVLNFLGLKISDRWVILDINDISEKRISSVNVENQTEIQMVITALAPGVYFVLLRNRLAQKRS